MNNISTDDLPEKWSIMGIARKVLKDELAPNVISCPDCGKIYEYLGDDLVTEMRINRFCGRHIVNGTVYTSCAGVHFLVAFNDNGEIDSHAEHRTLEHMADRSLWKVH